jgi:uncharacterized membrane protein
MIMMNLVFKVVMDAFILAFGISAAHFLIIGSAIGQAGFIGIFPFCLLFAVANLIISFMEIHKRLRENGKI